VPANWQARKPRKWLGGYFLKVMVFVDYENFRQSLWRIDKQLQPRVSKLSNFFVNKIAQINGWTSYNPRLIRLYAYTGYHSDSMIQKIKRDITWAKNQTPITWHLSAYEDLLNSCQIKKAKQAKFMNFNTNHCDFLEFRRKPLQYYRGKITQKGVDVQLAVDLVSHAYGQNFDVAVVCSGDVDLLESVKLVKNLGNKVIIASHPNTMAAAMETAADCFIDFSKLKSTEIEEIAFKVDTENKDVEINGRTVSRLCLTGTNEEYIKENSYIEPDFQ